MSLLKALFCFPLLASAAAITFSPATTHDIGVFARSSTLLLTDLTGDNRPDMVAVCKSPEPVIVALLNNGDGSFTTGQQYPIIRTPLFSALADFNEDGLMDVLVQSWDPFVTGTNASIYWGDGRGAFTNRTDFEMSDNYYSLLYTVGDFNDDGHSDMTFYMFSGNGTPDSREEVGVRLGNGDGTFRPTSTNSNPVTVMASVDFNTDGKDDLIVQSRSYQLGMLAANGDGTFARLRFFPAQKIFSASEQRRVARYVATSILTEDVNGDGIRDLISLEVDLLKQTGNDQLMAVRMGRKRGGFGLPKRYFKWSLASIGTGDLDGDGKADLVAGQSDQEDFVLVAQGTGRGRFASPIMVPLGIGGDQILVRDLNGDNRADLVRYSRNGGVISVLLSN